VRVLHGEPAGWYLLEDNGELYLDVNVSNMVVGFSVLIRLDRAERAAFAKRGRESADELAVRIGQSPGKYQQRSVTGPLDAQVTEAVLAYQRETGTGPGAAR
jgi:hypothetical protein